MSLLNQVHSGRALNRGVAFQPTFLYCGRREPAFRASCRRSASVSWSRFQGLGSVKALSRVRVCPVERATRRPWTCAIRPLTEEATVDALPAWATLEQVSYYWGTPDRLLNRLAISAGGLLVTSVLSNVLFNHLLTSLLNAVFFFYWVLEPAFLASRRNLALRRFPYIGLFCGTVREVYVTEAVLHRERIPSSRRTRFREVVQKRINVVAADPSGRRITISGPFRSREHRVLSPGLDVCMLVASDVPDFRRVGGVSDACIRVQRLTSSSEARSFIPPDLEVADVSDELRDLYDETGSVDDGVIEDDDFVWIGDYPFVNKEFFLELFDAALEPQAQQQQQQQRTSVMRRTPIPVDEAAVEAFARRRFRDDADDDDYDRFDTDDEDSDDFDGERSYRHGQRRRPAKRKPSKVRRSGRAPRERFIGDEDDNDDAEEKPWFSDDNDNDAGSGGDLGTFPGDDLDLEEDDEDDPRAWRYVRTVPARRSPMPSKPQQPNEAPDRADKQKQASDDIHRDRNEHQASSTSRNRTSAGLESVPTEQTLPRDPEKSTVD
jgi:hypothetical protein